MEVRESPSVSLTSVFGVPLIVSPKSEAGFRFGCVSVWDVGFGGCDTPWCWCFVVGCGLFWGCLCGVCVVVWVVCGGVRHAVGGGLFVGFLGCGFVGGLCFCGGWCMFFSCCFEGRRPAGSGRFRLVCGGGLRTQERVLCYFTSHLIASGAGPAPFVRGCRWA